MHIFLLKFAEACLWKCRTFRTVNVVKPSLAVSSITLRFGKSLKIMTRLLFNFGTLQQWSLEQFLSSKLYARKDYSEKIFYNPYN